MMGLLRKILFPLAVLYGCITQFRNFLYDRQWLKSKQYEVPVIAVGNLCVGGTGKSPMIEYLIRLFSEQYKVATLSRGYKRKSKGYVLADSNATVNMIGDEPFQFHSKFPNLTVAVDANRSNGIEQLLQQLPKPQIILLDDAFQHRKVKAGFYILLTSYGDLYADDYMLPTGNLRESKSGAKRADVIIVTKCPALLSDHQRSEIRQKLNLTARQQLYFTSIVYDDCIYSDVENLPVQQIRPAQKVLVAGIAKPKSFFAYLQDGDDLELTFADHHDFSQNDIERIIEKAHNRIIVTTEKDYVRLKGRIAAEQLFYLPIKTAFLADEHIFSQKLLQYVRSNIGM